MEPSDWLALAGIVSTLVIAVMTALLTERRERRQEKIKKDEQDRAHQFNIQAKQLELQYGRLHEKRVEAMAELFQQLESIRGKIDMIIHLGVYEGQNETKNLKKILKELDNSIVLFNKNKLYFSNELAGQIDRTILLISDIYSFAGRYLENPRDAEKWKPGLARWGERRGEIQETLDLVEAEFRKLLGS
jgi:hypothetical protein